MGFINIVTHLTSFSLLNAFELSLILLIYAFIYHLYSIDLHHDFHISYFYHYISDYCCLIYFSNFNADARYYMNVFTITFYEQLLVDEEIYSLAYSYFILSAY